MKVKELVEALLKEDQELRVYVEDGMDPSDYTEAKWVTVREAGNLYPYDLPKVLTIS